MGVNSLPKTATRQHRGCDLNPGPSAPESSTLTTQLPSLCIVAATYAANQVASCRTAEAVFVRPPTTL